MQELEYSPSVYFNFDNTINKENLSAEINFQLSCTNRKYVARSYEPIANSVIDLQQQVTYPTSSHLKTQEFFLEFEHNFIVTFEEGEPTNHLAQTGSFGKQDEVSQDKKEKDLPLVDEDQLEKVEICSLKQISKPSVLSSHEKNSIHEEFSLVRTTDDPKAIKEKESPIEFQVKKRTVFKNKENISNAQHFKITKKKIINQNTLELLSIQSKTCKTAKPKTTESQRWFTSHLASKNAKASQENPMKNLLIETNCHSNIFLEHKQARQSFRSTTLDNWKRKFQIQKKSLEQRPARRGNIFQNPFIFL